MSQNPFDRQAPIPGIKHILVVGSGKGGVGKSTVAVNLAMALKKSGHQVGLMDADIYGPSLPRMMGALQQKPEVNEKGQIQPLLRHGLKLMSMGFMVDEGAAVVWRGPMLFKAMDQFFRDVAWGELDYLVIDLPPGTGDVALTVAQKVPVSGAIVVCTPQNMALIDAKKAMDMFERLRIPILGVVENMSYFVNPENQERIQLFPQGDLNNYLKAKNFTKLAEVPFHPHVALSSEAGVPMVESQPDSPEALAFQKLAQEVGVKAIDWSAESPAPLQP